MSVENANVYRCPQGLPLRWMPYPLHITFMCGCCARVQASVCTQPLRQYITHSCGHYPAGDPPLRFVPYPSTSRHSAGTGRGTRQAARPPVVIDSIWSCLWLSYRNQTDRCSEAAVPQHDNQCWVAVAWRLQVMCPFTLPPCPSTFSGQDFGH